MYTVILAICAFLLGAVPFSVLIGRWVLRKDITAYGDGNPGAANVWRAGGPVLGMVAVVLDVAKGVPCVLLSHVTFGMAESASVFLAVCAVLGHAFSPFLRWHGGKAIAVSFGVMLGLLPQYDVLVAFIAFIIPCALIVGSDSWSVIIAAIGALAYLSVFNGYSWKPVLMLCILVIFVIKHYDDLRRFPNLHGRLSRWFQTR